MRDAKTWIIDKSRGDKTTVPLGLIDDAEVSDVSLDLLFLRENENVPRANEKESGRGMGE
jgi:hypothetical protein